MLDDDNLEKSKRKVEEGKKNRRRLIMVLRRHGKKIDIHKRKQCFIRFYYY
jgi:hypothetical protein